MISLQICVVIIQNAKMGVNAPLTCQRGLITVNVLHRTPALFAKVRLSSKTS